MIYGGNAIWNKYVLSFFIQKIAIASDVFKVISSSFQTLGAATESVTSQITSRVSQARDKLYNNNNNNNNKKTSLAPISSVKSELSGATKPKD